jgi:hypothetical protein
MKLLYVVIFSSILINAFGQSFESKSYSIFRADGPIEIDGKITESSWSSAMVATDFWKQAPVDDAKAEEKTEVKLCYDNQYLFVSAIMYGSRKRVVQTLKRDNFGDSDEFGVFIDPLGQKSFGYGFGVNSMNAQSDALVGPDDADAAWDAKWYSAVQNEDDKWVVEMAIPFKSIRFKDNIEKWAINFVRIAPSINEVHTWNQVPRQFEFLDLGYYGHLQWDVAPKGRGKNISFLPYSTVQAAKNEPKVDLNAGIEMKAALTTSLNLDLAFNPDFSQVDVDEQVTNLTRFSIFFPERRQFFLENNDVFSDFGLNDESLFYSRRIGLDANGQKIPIQYGARISGNLTDKTRIGAFNILTDSKGLQAKNNYSAFAIQRRILKRSSIKAIYLNRQALGGQNKNDYGRNAGLNLNFTSTDGRYSLYGGLLHSSKYKINDRNLQSYGGINYAGQNFRAYIEVQNVGRNFYSDMGFNNRLENFDPAQNIFVRIGYTNVGNMFNYYHYPKQSKSVNLHWSGLENFVWFNENTGFNEYYNRIRHFIFFKNRTELKFRFNNHVVNILYPFEIGDYTIAKDKYVMHEFNTQFITDNTQKLVFDAFAVYGDYYGGTKITLRSGIKLRLQPWLNVRFGIDQNNIKFGDLADVNLTLLNNSTEINFSNKLFWTTFVQYISQRNAFFVNSRIQYRYRPMSDIFLVLNDNYDTLDRFTNRERILTLKVNYWFGL